MQFMQIVFLFILQQFQNKLRMFLQGEMQKRKYNRPTYQTRVQLINMVQRQGQTIKNSAKILNIKESTAKLIVSRFRTCGTIYQAKKNRIIRKCKAKAKKPTKSMKSQQNDNVMEQGKDHRVEVQNNTITHQQLQHQLPTQLPYHFFYDFMPVLYYPLQVHPN